MPYAYHCPWCGQTHQMDEMLIDLAPVISDGSIRILKLQMTVGELNTIAAKGPQSKKLEEKEPWSPSFSELMTIVAGRHNLNNPAIQDVTMEDINAFLDRKQEASRCVEYEDFESVFGECLDVEEVKTEPDVPDYEPSAPLRAILDCLTQYYGECISGALMASDLEVIRGIYDRGNPRLFVRPISMEGVTTGFHFMYRSRHYWINNRLCPSCGCVVPEQACTVPQKTVAFFGKNLTSKTSTLLALTHYALNGSLPRFVHPIWKDAERLTQVRRFELLCPSQYLCRDLENYERGISPPKYGIQRAEQPVAHLLVTNTDGSQSILTLINPPGEICGGREEGIKVDLLFNEFPAILSADVLIHCVSFNNLERDTINTDLRSAESLMVLMADAGNACPVLTLFTDLPAEYRFEKQEFSPGVLNMLQSEYNVLRETGKTAYYLYEIERLSRMCMDSATIYRNVMHCHPLGCDTPVVYENTLKYSPQPVPPAPENIPLLMQWILYATGILTAEITHPSTGEYKSGRITRSQYRCENPINRSEAVARCILFRNPGRNDLAMARASNKSRQLLAKVQMLRRPNS